MESLLQRGLDVNYVHQAMAHEVDYRYTYPYTHLFPGQERRWG